MECKCYNHTPQSLARGIMGVRCQRVARWSVTITNDAIPCCDKHKKELALHAKFYERLYDNG